MWHTFHTGVSSVLGGGRRATGLLSIVPPALLKGGHSGDLGGEGARERRKGGGVGTERTERGARADKDSLLLALRLSLFLSLSRTQAASFHPLSLIHWRRHTRGDGHMSIYATDPSTRRLPRFAFQSFLFSKRGRVYLFIYRSIYLFY